MLDGNGHGDGDGDDGPGTLSLLDGNGDDDDGNSDDSDASTSHEGFRSDRIQDHGLNWIQVFSSLLNIGRPWQGPKLRVMTLCSGTDSIVRSLELIVGKDKVEHLVACDNMPAAQTFIQQNFHPKHLYGDISCTIAKSAFCFVCNSGSCTGIHDMKDDETDAHVGAAGFPCPPYSLMRNGRFKAGDDPFAHSAARPFFAIRDYLETAVKPPRVFILENVAGVLSSRKNMHDAPLDFMMYGSIRVGNAKKKRVGLKFLTQYHVAPVQQVTADVFGLPFPRPRVLWFLFRKDVFSQEEVDQTIRNFTVIRNNPLPIKHIREFIDPESDDDYVGASPSKKRKTAVLMSPATAVKCDIFREKHQVLPRSDEEGQPFTSTLTADSPLFGLERECELIDIVYLLVKQAGGQRADVTIDLSQSIDRLKFKMNGQINTLTTGSKIFYGGTETVITYGAMFRCMGWAPASFEVPPSLTQSQVTTLVGNMWAPPVAGGALLSILGLFEPQMDPDSDSA